MSSRDDDSRVQQRGPEGNIEEYVPRDDGHQALREMLRVTGSVAILRNGPLRQAVLALLTDRDEMAVDLARADEENDKLRELNRARILGTTPEFLENATEPMQRAMQRAVMLRKSMNDVWRAALSELGA